MSGDLAVASDGQLSCQGYYACAASVPDATSNFTARGADLVSVAISVTECTPGRTHQK